MNLLLLFSLSLSWGVEEPEAINEEEKHDEVAQSQERAMWFACMMLARDIILTNEETLSTISKKRGSEYKMVKRKVAADVLTNCLGKLTPKEAEELLRDDKIDLSRKEVAGLAEINFSAYETGDLTYTSQQSVLLAKIENTAKRTDDLYDQPVSEPEILVTSQNAHISLIVAGVAAVLVVLGIAVVAYKTINKQKPVPKKKGKKKD